MHLVMLLMVTVLVVLLMVLVVVDVMMSVVMMPVVASSCHGAPSGIRTHTVQGLSLLPLPLGYKGSKSR